jgi:predicted dehydrogenase
MIEKILVAGNGSIGKRHLRLARQQFPNAEIVVLGYREVKEIPAFANGYLKTIQAAIEFAPQLAVIANPSTFHIPIAQALARAGTNLLIEKPISSDSNGVHELIEICKEHNCVLQLGYNLRYSPSLQRFRELLHAGVIGDSLSVRCEVGQYLPTWRPEIDYRLGVSANKNLGGGVLLELSHELDYLQWIFGDVDWVRATISRQSSLEIDVEDSVHLTLGFLSHRSESQLIGTLNLDFIRHDQTRTCTAIGKKGSLRWNGLAGEVSIFEESASSWKTLFTHTPMTDETYLAEWHEFVDCSNTGRIPSVSGQDGLRVLKVIESARISASTGAQVSVADNRKSKRKIL